MKNFVLGQLLKFNNIISMSNSTYYSKMDKKTARNKKNETAIQKEIKI